MDKTGGKKVSLHDVARASGVSVSTVSRALTHPDRIAPKTRDHILSVARTLGYHPNLAARNLRLGQPKTILAIMPHHKFTMISTVTHDAQIGIAGEIRNIGYALNVLTMDHSRTTTAAALDSVYGRQVSGTILMAEQPFELDGRKLMDAGLPVVSLSEDLTHFGIPSVVSSDRQSMMDAVERLLSLGHKTFFFIAGPASSYHSRQREAGVRSALLRHFGTDSGLVKFPADFKVTAGVAAARHYLALTDRPTAVLCWADEPALGFQSEVLKAGLRIPSDLSLLSFDGLIAVRYTHPAICTYDQNMRQLAAHAARLLIDMIDNGKPSESLLIEYPAELVNTESLGPAPIRAEA